MLKKLVLFVAAVMLLTSSVQAALNTIDVPTTLSTIYTGTTGQAGSIGFTLSDGTEFGVGNSTQISLPQGVSLAQSYDFYIVGDNGAINGLTTGPLVGKGTKANDLVIRVTGSEGGSGLSMTVLRGSIKPTGAGDQVTIVLFDGTNATDHTKAALWTGDWTGAAFNASTVKNATAEQNTLCIKVDAAYKDKYVSIGLENRGLTYIYQPSTPNIAEIKPKSITLMPLKAERTYRLGSGQAASCFVDYEVGPFCEGGWANGTRGYVAFQNGDLFPAGTYTVTAEVLVDGAAGAKGAYFQGAVSKIQFIENQGDVANSAYVADELALSEAVYYTTGDVVTTKLPTTCSPANDAKVVKVVSKTAANAVTPALVGKKFLRVDIPALTLVESELPKNAKVGVKVTVAKGCGSFIEESIETLFTVVEKCTEKKGAAGSLLFPYFADAPFWNGMALTNTGDAPVNASLAIVDEKGGKGSIDIMVPANGMYVNLVEKIIADSAFNGTVDKALRCYITVTPQSGRLVGFAMMGNAGESMGYTVNN